MFASPFIFCVKFTRTNICHECGNLMEFEDEKWRDTLVCPNCGHSVDLDHYGCEGEEEYESLYPTLEEVIESDK